MAEAMDDPHKFRDLAAPQEGYALSGKIMLSAIVVLFAVVVFIVGLHLYARWYLLRLRHREHERRRRRRASRSQVLVMADGRRVQAPTADCGLDKAVLSSLPVFLHSTEAKQPSAECAVCLSEFEGKEIVRLLPKCSHVFHIECIGMWFYSHSTCPLCRSPVEKVVETAFKPAEKANSSESDCSPLSQSGDRRKVVEVVGVSIEIPARDTPVNELSQCSPPASRLWAFKRILSSMAAGGGSTTPRGAGSSPAGGELDVESGLSESRSGDRA